MADLKISQLPEATSSSGTDILPIVQSNATKKLAIANLVPQNLKSKDTTGVVQITGPAAAATRVLTVPDANATLLYAGGPLGAPLSGDFSTGTFTWPTFSFIRSTGSYVFGATSTVSSSASTDVCSIAFGAFSGRGARVGVTAGVRSGSGGARLAYAEQLVRENGGNALSFVSLVDSTAGNMTINFNTSTNTLTINVSSAVADTETLAVSVEIYSGDLPSLTVNRLI